MTKQIYCFNCGKAKDVSDNTDPDYECIECKGNNIEWSQTE